MGAVCFSHGATLFALTSRGGEAAGRLPVVAITGVDRLGKDQGNTPLLGVFLDRQPVPIDLGLSLQTQAPRLGGLRARCYQIRVAGRGYMPEG